MGTDRESRSLLFSHQSVYKRQSPIFQTPHFARVFCNAPACSNSSPPPLPQLTQKTQKKEGRKKKCYSVQHATTFSFSFPSVERMGWVNTSFRVRRAGIITHSRPQYQQRLRLMWNNQEMYWVARMPGKMSMPQKVKKTHPVSWEKDKKNTNDKMVATCIKCENNRAYYMQLQIRSADEPSTIFYRCTNCAHGWREG